MFSVLTLQALLFRIFGRLRIEVAVFTGEEPVHGFGGLAKCRTVVFPFASRIDAEYPAVHLALLHSRSQPDEPWRRRDRVGAPATLEARDSRSESFSLRSGARRASTPPPWQLAGNCQGPRSLQR